MPKITAEDVRKQIENEDLDGVQILFNETFYTLDVGMNDNEGDSYKLVLTKTELGETLGDDYVNFANQEDRTAWNTVLDALSHNIASYINDNLNEK